MIGDADGDGARFSELIRSQAAREVDEIVAEAQAHAVRSLAAAQAEAEAIHAKARAEGEARGRREAARVTATAEARARREWLWAREHLIEAALGRLRARCGDFATLPEAATMLTGLISEALAALPDGAVRVYLPAAYAALIDATTWQRLGAGRWTIEARADPTAAAGVVAETADGRQRFDNTFEGRIRRSGEQLRQVIAEVLFGS